MAEAPGSRTQPARETRAATDFEDREGHRAPFASVHFDYIAPRSAAREFTVDIVSSAPIDDVDSGENERRARGLRRVQRLAEERHGE